MLHRAGTITAQTKGTISSHLLICSYKQMGGDGGVSMQRNRPMYLCCAVHDPNVFFSFYSPQK